MYCLRGIDMGGKSTQQGSGRKDDGMIKAIDEVIAELGKFDPGDERDREMLKDVVALLEREKEGPVLEEDAGAHLDALEGAGIRVPGSTREEKLVNARGLHTVIFKWKILERLRGIEKYRDATVTGGEFYEGGGGAHIINLKLGSGKQTLVIIKKGDGSAEEFGTRLASAAGLNAAKLHHGTGQEFVIIESIYDYEGETIEVRSFQGQGRMKVSSIGLIEKDLVSAKSLEEPTAAARDFWGLIGESGGRAIFLRAWLDFYEFSRLALLSDRQPRNAAAAFERDKTGKVTAAHILPIDMDPTAHSMGHDSDERRLKEFNEEFGLNNYVLVMSMADSSKVAAKRGLCSSELSKKEMLDEMKALIRERMHKVPEGYSTLKESVIAAIKDPANVGMAFGMPIMDRKVGLPSPTDAQMRRQMSEETQVRLIAFANKLATPEERRRFMETQIKMLDQLEAMVNGDIRTARASPPSLQY